MLRYTRNPDPPVNIIHYIGEITDEGLMRFFEELALREDYDGDLPELDDMSGVTSWTVSSAGIHSLAKLALSVRAHAYGARTALYAPTDLSFGLSRMFQAFVEGSPDQYAVFRDYAAACEWVGLPAGSR
jgi:hypothetical protein